MKDRLQHILEVQKKFESNFFNPYSMSDEDKEYWTKEFIIHMISETNELLNEINWKHHINKHDVQKSRVTEEIVDILKYFLNSGGCRQKL